MKNCLNCTRYLVCGVAEKGANYVCTRHIRREVAPIDWDAPIQRTEDADEDYVDTPVAASKPRTTRTYDLDIESMFDQVLKQDNAVPVDMRIDDRDIWQAPNFAQFCLDSRGLKNRPYVRQLELATKLLSEWCPNCSDVEWFRDKVEPTSSHSEFFERVTLLKLGKCPKCKITKSELINDGHLPFYFELAACLGQRAGKSAIVDMIFAYLLHIFLKLQRPNQVYGVEPSNVFHMTMVAVTFKQAQENLWDPFYSILSKSPWFKTYHDLLNDYGRRYGEEIYKLKDTFVLYRHRSIFCSPGTPDKRTLRGRTRLVYAIDELGWFDNKRDETKVRVNATEVHKALSNSLQTVRSAAMRLVEQGYNNIPTGMALNISSPSSPRDKIIELVNASKFSKRIFGMKCATWEFNPKIRREDLEDEFRRDPVEAERDYGANPPLTDKPFISSWALIEPCFSNGNNPIEVMYGQTRMRDGSITRFAKVKRLRKLGVPSILALDAGYSNNSFAMAVGHLHDGEPRIDMVVEVQPLPNIPVNFSKIYEELLVPIIKELDVQAVVSDRWQNIKILHDLERDLSVTTIQHRLRYDELWLVRQKMYDGEILLPRFNGSIEEVMNYDYDEYPHCFVHKPIHHLILQALTVQDMGTQVIKGQNLTDDLFRAVLLACAIMSNETHKPLFERNVRNVAIGVSRHFGSGSTSTSGTTRTTSGKVLGMVKSLR